jgi:hypothetical protein
MRGRRLCRESDVGLRVMADRRQYFRLRLDNSMFQSWEVSSR